MRKIVITLICIALLAVSATALHVSHVLSFYRLGDNACLPAHKANHLFVYSKLKKYRYQQLVCFTQPNGDQHHTYIRRLFGLEGDTIELNDGYLLRNGIMVDHIHCVMFNYCIHAGKIQHFDFLKELKQKPGLRNDSIIICADYNDSREISRNVLLYRTTKRLTFDDPPVYGGNTSNGWTALNYGPIVVPKGYCFVLADNRGNYDDSRFWGCIPVAGILGTVLGR